MTAIYKISLTAPFGKFIVAVESTENDARSDAMGAALSEFHCHAGMLRVGQPAKSSRAIVRTMEPIASSAGKHWAWIKKVS